MKKGLSRIHPTVFILLIGLVGGCVHHNGKADAVQNPDAAPLRIQRLAEGISRSLASGSEGEEIYIIVHPAYSVFVDDMHKKEYSRWKRKFAQVQYENEAKFIERRAREGKIVVLVVPSDGEGSRTVPPPYHPYLNRLAVDDLPIFYTLSQTTKNGALGMEDMIVLYRFLDAVRARAAYVGGGYIGRCQQEFIDQLTRYFDASRTYLVPEASTVSPEDVTEREADTMLAGIARGDYSPVREFIGRRTGGTANILSSRM